jgi:hypothetical protein
MDSTMERNKLGRVLLVALAGVAIWGLSRGLIFRVLVPIPDPPDLAAYGDSRLVTLGLFGPVIGVVGIIMMVLFAYAFLSIQAGLPGGPVLKGAIFGGAFCLMFLMSFFELYHYFKGSLGNAILSGAADGVPVLLTGLILGAVLGSPRARSPNRVGSPARAGAPHLLAIVIVALFFTIGRAVFYVSYPGPSSWEAESYLFVFLYGASIGLSYFVFGRGISASRPFSRSLHFGLVYAVVAIPGNFLICFKLGFPPAAMGLMVLLDLAGIVAGGWVSELLPARR